MKSHTISARNVNSALPLALAWLCAAGQRNDSRNGAVLVAPGPVITEYSRPQERVLFSPERDANPFFHLYECVWMLAGRSDAAAPARYAKNMLSYAEDDGHFHAAYGRRWTGWFGDEDPRNGPPLDQIQKVVDMLRADPKTRRAVIAMWDPCEDLNVNKKDLPCNTTIYFDATRGPLDMTVCNRSNDAIYGAYGANAVHMSFLHEVVAGCAGLKIGTYYQVSNNLHIYLDNPVTQRLVQVEPGHVHTPRIYEPDGVAWNYPDFEPIFTPNSLDAQPIWSLFRDECEAACACVDGWNFSEEPYPNIADCGPYHYPWFKRVFFPLMLSHAAYKAGNHVAADVWARECQSEDWSLAALQWLARRMTAAAVTELRASLNVSGDSTPKGAA